MGLLSLILPIVGQPDKTEDVKIPNALAAIQSWANGGIDATNITNEAITDAKVVKGRELVTTGNAYGTLTARLSGTEYEASATRMTFVTVEAEVGSGQAGEMKVWVGGVMIATPKVSVSVGGSSSRIVYSFLVSPGAKWKVECTQTSSPESSYLFL